MPEQNWENYKACTSVSFVEMVVGKNSVFWGRWMNSVLTVTQKPPVSVNCLKEAIWDTAWVSLRQSGAGFNTSSQNGTK